MAAPLGCMLPVTSQYSDGVFTEAQSLSSKIHTTNNVVVAGKNQTLLTSLLQQAAVSYSSAECPTVFIRPNALTALPLPVHGMHRMCYATVQNIQYMYMETAQELIKYLCTLNNSQPFLPEVIIIDGFDFYVNQLQYSSEISVSKLSSLLLDSLLYIAERRGEHSTAIISISDTLRPHLTIYGRYFDVHLLTQDDEKDESSTYTLERLTTMPAEGVMKCHITVDKFICLRSVDMLALQSL